MADTASSAPLHVLHVGCLLDPERRSGAELLEAWPTLQAVAGAVRDAGARVSVLHAGARDEVIERARISYHFVSEWIPARMPGTRGAAVPLRLAKRAASLRPDVVHLNGLGFPVHALALSGALPGVPILLQDHADGLPRRLKRLHRRGWNAASGVAFTAAAQAEPFRRAGMRGDLPVFEIPESSSRFQPGDGAAARSALGVSGDPALIWIGRLNENKDPLTVLEGVARAAVRAPGLTLWCCFTEAPLLAAVERRVAEDERLRGRVHLMGRLPAHQVETLCRAGDLFLSGSHREGSGYALVEALACGATPIVTDIPAFRALTADGAVGRLVPVGDASAFAGAIEQLAGQDRAELRRKARAHFEGRLSFEVLGQELMRTYRSLRGARG